MLLGELESRITVITQKEHTDMEMGAVFQKIKQILQTVHNYSFTKRYDFEFILPYMYLLCKV